MLSVDCDRLGSESNLSFYPTIEVELCTNHSFDDRLDAARFPNGVGGTATTFLPSPVASPNPSRPRTFLA